MVWHSHLLKNFPQFVVIHTVKGFGIVNKAEVDVFLEFPCFLYDLTNVGNLIFGSSAFSKSSLNTWKFTVHILLKPGFSNYHIIAFISYTSKVMLKILQARLQQYVNKELPDVQADVEKAEETEIKLPTSVGS